MIKATIIAEIEVKSARLSYGSWRIGITNDPVGRKQYWGETEGKYVELWSQWEADSLSDAQDIEAYFINKGMEGGTGGGASADKPVFVYIF